MKMPQIYRFVKREMDFLGDELKNGKFIKNIRIAKLFIVAFIKCYFYNLFRCNPIVEQMIFENGTQACFIRHFLIMEFKLFLNILSINTNWILPLLMENENSI